MNTLLPESDQSIEVISPTRFRQILAGLVDVSAIPDGPAGAGYVAEFRDISSLLCCVLARLYGSTLDRINLWGRIATAISTSVAKCGDGDIDRLVSLMLEHVQADPVYSAACEPLHGIFGYRERPETWRQQFTRYLGANIYAVVSHGRAKWEQIGGDLKNL